MQPRDCGGDEGQLALRLMPLVSIIHRPGNLYGGYVLHALATHWRADGITVQIGAQFAAEADLGVLHVNQTFVEKSFQPLAGGVTLNGSVLDISKRRISTLMLTPESNWRGAVIVKSNLNHFGLPERIGRQPRWREKVRGWAAELSWRHARQLPHKTYPVLSSLAQVPGWVWRDEGLIVEKFMPEREGALYCLRGWLFLGSAGYGYRLFSTDPMVKTGTMVRHEPLAEVPAQLQAMRKSLGFDYGKFDYVMHDGVPICWMQTARRPLPGIVPRPGSKPLPRESGTTCDEFS
jgi:hypothetical protein